MPKMSKLEKKEITSSLSIQVTVGGGSPVISTSTSVVWPSLITMLFKFVRSILGFTGKKRDKLPIKHTT